MKIKELKIDEDFEGDGLIGVTFWVDSAPPRYIALSRDELESPDVVEAEDQIYGHRPCTRDPSGTCATYKNTKVKKGLSQK